MNTLDTDEKLARRARELFLASVAGLDAGVVARLRETRLKALEAAEAPRSAWGQGWRMPASAMALVLVGVVGGALWWNGLTGPVAAPESLNTASSEDLPIVLTSDSLDMYADLDFYQWLETQDKSKAATPPPDQTDDSDDSDDVGG
ncbi:MAG TPA: hypothetical protein VGO35_10685 [Gammaproteobacteria bacterium]|jgi:hypothetical protein|nr:hypothetical protein [Gammaproteobacteria bacterium]